MTIHAQYGPLHSKSEPLRGKTDNVLDVKSRLTVPSQFRERLIKENTIVLAVGLKSRLALWHPDAWEQYKNERASRNPDPLIELVENGSHGLYAVDAQARVRIPLGLRNECFIRNDKVSLVGNETHVMIWDCDDWTEFSAQVRTAMATRTVKPGS